MIFNTTQNMNIHNGTWDHRLLSAERKISIPPIVWVVLISTGFAIFGGRFFLGRNIAGLSWVICFLFSTWTILNHPTRIKFPFWIWLPWIALLLIHLILSNYGALHRTLQLICPIMVGMAVSTCNINRRQLAKFFNLCRKFAFIIVFMALLKTGTLLTGVIPSTTGLAAEVMAAILLCNLFAVNYSFGNKKEIFRWGLMAALPVFAVTRTAIAAAGLTLPLTLGPLGLSKRAIFLIAGIFIGLAIFYSPRVQNKMFYTGQGQIEDVLSDSKKLDDSGRSFMWDWFVWKIERKPWTGYGTGSGESFARKITGGIGYPHNDWLLTAHDQGIIGVIIYGLCIIISFFHAWHKARNSIKEVKILFLAGASAFVSLALLMITDNIMVYASFFGNLHFTILGLAYAASNNQPRQKINENTSRT